MDINRLLKRVIRIGKVVDIDPQTCRARVFFPDGEYMSPPLPVLQQHSFKDKFYFMPSVDEYVVCAFIPVGMETGFIIGAYYSSEIPTPVCDEGKFNITFEDGTAIEYDKKTHFLTADVKGSANIKADDNRTVQCTNATLNADKVVVNSPDVSIGTGSLSGIITQQCYCALTGYAHPDASLIVKGAK